MSNVISIQPGQPGEGMGYNVHKPLPYPFHIDPETGRCIRGRGTADLGEAPPGDPWVLVGFQTGDVQHVVLFLREFAQDPQKAVGLVPVFIDERGMFALTVPITNVTVR